MSTVSSASTAAASSSRSKVSKQAAPLQSGEKFADDAGDRPRLLNKQHVRRPRDHRKASARNLLGDRRNDFGRRRLIKFAGNAKGRHLDRTETGTGIDRSHSAPSLRPGLDIIGQQTIPRGIRCAACAKFRGEPAVKCCIKHDTHAVTLRLCAALRRYHTVFGLEGGRASADRKGSDILWIFKREVLRHHAAKGEPGDGGRCEPT